MEDENQAAEGAENAAPVNEDENNVEGGDQGENVETSAPVEDGAPVAPVEGDSSVA